MTRLIKSLPETSVQELDGRHAYSRPTTYIKWNVLVLVVSGLLKLIL